VIGRDIILPPNTKRKEDGEWNVRILNGTGLDKLRMC